MKTAYVLKQLTPEGLWTSPEVFHHEPHQIPRVVIAGYLAKQPRWAETPEGVFLYGLDAKGKGMERAPC